MSKRDKTDKGEGPALRPDAEEYIATSSTSSSPSLAPTREDEIMANQGTRETVQRETILAEERPNERPVDGRPQEQATRNVFPPLTSRPTTVATPPSFNPQAPNPFQNRTAAETYGFMSAAESRALTDASSSTPPIAAPPPPPLQSSLFRPLAPNEFLFDPALSPRRRAAIVGGWVASDGSAAPRPDVVNAQMEPVGAGAWKKTHRGKRGGKKNRRGRGGGVYRGRVGKGKGAALEASGSPVSEGGGREGGRGAGGCETRGFKLRRRGDRLDDDEGDGGGGGLGFVKTSRGRGERRLTLVT